MLMRLLSLACVVAVSAPMRPPAVDSAPGSPGDVAENDGRVTQCVLAVACRDCDAEFQASWSAARQATTARLCTSDLAGSPLGMPGASLAVGKHLCQAEVRGGRTSARQREEGNGRWFCVDYLLGG